MLHSPKKNVFTSFSNITKFMNSNKINLASNYRAISYYWTEKLFLLLEMLQYAIIVINIILPWLPVNYFIYLVKSDTVCNFIFPSLKFVSYARCHIEKNALKTDIGTKYILTWNIATLIILFALACLVIFLKQNRNLMLFSSVRLLLISSFLLMYLTVGFFMNASLPIEFNWFHGVQQSSLSTRVTLTITTFLLILSSIALILSVVHFLGDGILLRQNFNYLEQRELEFTLKLNDLWATRFIFVYSSFSNNLYGTYYYCLTIIIKFFLILIHSTWLIISQKMLFPSNQDIATNTIEFRHELDTVYVSLVFAINLIYILCTILYPPYRCFSTCFLKLLMLVSTTVLMIFAIFGLSSAIYEEWSIEYKNILIAIQISILGIIILVVFYSISRTFLLRGIVEIHTEPMNMKKQDEISVEFQHQELLNNNKNSPEIVSKRTSSFVYCRHSPWPINATSIELLKGEFSELFSSVREMSKFIYEYPTLGLVSYYYVEELYKRLHNDILTYNEKLSNLCVTKCQSTKPFFSIFEFTEGETIYKASHALQLILSSLFVEFCRIINIEGKVENQSKES